MMNPAKETEHIAKDLFKTLQNFKMEGNNEVDDFFKVMNLFNKLSEALQSAYGVGYGKGYQDGVNFSISKQN